MPRRTAQWIMIACLISAAWLRLNDLESFPPGLHFDEAANLILAGDIGLRGDRPVFISSYTGKEALFFYAAGGVMAGVGESIFALRLTAAFFGILTVAAAYRLGVLLLRRRDVAVLAATLLAVSFWHLLFSRLGFRAVSQPLLQGLAVIGLFNVLFSQKSSTNNGIWPSADLWLTGLFLGGGGLYLLGRQTLSNRPYFRTPAAGFYKGRSPAIFCEIRVGNGPGCCGDSALDHLFFSGSGCILGAHSTGWPIWIYPHKLA